MKKIILGVCVVLLALTACQQAKQKVFKLASDQINKECPMIIDDMTTMDSTTYSDGSNTLTYFYTLSDVDDPEMVELIKKEMEEVLPKTIRETEDLKIFRDAKVTFKYIYLSKENKQELFQITASPDMYK